MKRYIFLILIILILGGIFVWQTIYLPRNPSSKTEVVFKIEKGEGSRGIALNLEKAGLIKWEPPFRVYVLLKGVAERLQAGDYQLSPSMNIPEIVDKLVRGDVIKEKITFPEGFNLKEIKERFESSEFLQTIDLEELKISDFKGEFEFLSEAPDEASLEGFLFPDTYFFDSDMKEREIAEIFFKNFDKELTQDLRDEIKRQEKTIFEIVTMASLIEKEVITYEDKEIVSGILWKRLKNDMFLQVDAEMGTYEYKGLPPGPICNPGLESILAALYPKESSYWYYLSAPDGKTIFSRTLGEHNIAKAKYLR